ncbi:glucose 1-dehydrogenase [Devosia sp. MC532]|uniref:glucose 1-dehydrogenase n=1 Tax=Devosia sp. MC532 TaxID=2799788 RepID=UPI0018F36C14|nr:glucose 1-dehydrogenase [Devosia sp. MC532]MBJ7577827.1 glucose 1-dehydrogenase [Devosia sp. MC532]
MRLQDKVAVVTGAGSGIGFAIAKRFAAEGAKVVAVDLDADAVDAAVTEIDGAIVGVRGDVAQEADCIAMIDRAVADFGRLDILVNNAGVMDLFQSVADVDNATWRRCMSVNVDGPMYAMRRAVPLMLAQGGGSIVNIASVAAIGGGAAGAAYTASKHALIGLTKSTAFQYAKYGLRCNALALGGVRTNIMDSVKGQALDQAALGRLGAYQASNPGMLDPDDIANAVLFVASDEARHLNGAVLPVDMGWSAA